MGTRSHLAEARCWDECSTANSASPEGAEAPLPPAPGARAARRVSAHKTRAMIPLPARASRAAAALLALAVWAWPVADPIVIARPYVAPATPYGAGHRGVDLHAAEGAEIRSPADGVVHFAGVVVDRPVLSIRHADGVISSFEPVIAVVAAGDPVQRGQLIGHLEPGHCALPCLHLGARIDGGYVNPLLLLGGLPRSVLLPTRAPP